MSKQDIIDLIAKKADITKVAASAVVATFIEAISTSLKKGQDVTLIGFGTFSVKKRAARVGRNPQTGKEIKIAAKRVVRFKPGTALKEIVQK